MWEKISIKINDIHKKKKKDDNIVQNTMICLMLNKNQMRN